MFRGLLLLVLSGITAAQFPVSGDQEHLVSSISDYLEESEICYKCDDEVSTLKEVIANQSRILAQQSGLISTLQSRLDSVVARVDCAEQFMGVISGLSEGETICSDVGTWYSSPAYGTIDEYGRVWEKFWWWKAGSSWSSLITDVLQESYGTCDPGSDYCMGRLPSWLKEDGTELLAKDSRGNVYKWEFDPNNPTAHAAWLAFYGHQETPSGQIVNNMAWMPSVFAGTGPKATQDSFMYRTENGVKSILLDDDNCDCYTSLNIGHGMCGASHHTGYGPRGQYGVDALYDSYCNVPVPSIGLELYFNRT
ncbi:Hypp5763 [Branchiostoma lanceolatum]|uniref:Hypp5763 protein n=1 Tax=Branchiostoma lanceolatum TaxID=7740 RepID=A0A8J9VRI8_BRALA|nr:Hypp5763 [Branchiostoma lanceolatum]